MDFFAKKISTLFTRFDMDKNGKIEEDDFDTWSNKLISIGILNAAQAEHLRKSMKSIWTTYFLPADTDKDGSVTVDELIVHMRSVIEKLNQT
jgi:Ca2+-binding EF-hand superfamily protein